MAPYKNHSGENKLNQGKKYALYKNDSGQKNRSQTVEDKKWHLIKMTVAKINEPHRAR